MHYKKHYINLIRKARNREALNCYTEKHHVFPKSIFGNNNFIVTLTAKEHYIAHFLLWKYYKSKLGANHYKTKKMCYAFNTMTWIVGERYTSSTFNIARKAMAICNTGDANPAKRPEVRKKISKAKQGVVRLDMTGKRYFGASEEKITQGIEKMSKKKTGMKIDYPKNRKSPACSTEKRNKISESRLQTKNKFIEMSEEEFTNWIKLCKMYRKDGRTNPNITRAIRWRNEDIYKYYPKS